MQQPIHITHNQAKNRFETMIDNHIGYISYREQGDNLIYDHTIVPSELGGKGVGSALVKHALDYARSEGKKVRSECSFVDAYFNKHAEYQDLLK